MAVEHLPQVESGAFLGCRSHRVLLNNQIGPNRKEGTNAGRLLNRQDQTIGPSSPSPADVTRLQQLWEQAEYQALNQRRPAARHSRRMLVLVAEGGNSVCHEGENMKNGSFSESTP